MFRTFFQTPWDFVHAFVSHFSLLAVCSETTGHLQWIPWRWKSSMDPTSTGATGSHETHGMNTFFVVGAFRFYKST